MIIIYICIYNVCTDYKEVNCCIVVHLANILITSTYFANMFPFINYTKTLFNNVTIITARAYRLTVVIVKIKFTVTVENYIIFLSFKKILQNIY